MLLFPYYFFINTSTPLSYKNVIKIYVITITTNIYAGEPEQIKLMKEKATKKKKKIDTLPT